MKNEAEEKIHPLENKGKEFLYNISVNSIGIFISFVLILVPLGGIALNNMFASTIGFIMALFYIATFTIGRHYDLYLKKILIDNATLFFGINFAFFASEKTQMHLCLNRTYVYCKCIAFKNFPYFEAQRQALGHFDFNAHITSFERLLCRIILISSFIAALFGLMWAGQSIFNFFNR